MFEFLVTLNKHKIKGYLLEEAGIFGGGTGMCGICDSWFCILRDRHCTVDIEEVRVKNRILTNSTAHTMGFFLKAGLFGRGASLPCFTASLWPARWGLTPRWNVTESHLSRDFLMLSTDSEQFWCCYVENVFHWSRASLPLVKGGSDERSGSFLT